MDARTAPGVRLLPNAITVLALCSGLSAVQFAVHREWAMAVGAIAVAAVLDSVDGRLARLLDATSRIGAELDSLSDAVSFGVAPALVLFMWGWQGDRSGWIAALIYTVCTVLRLARFNTLLEDTEKPPYTKEFFFGVPSPAGALLALLPLVVSLQFDRGWWSSRPALWVWTLIISALMISRVPTLSLKKISVPPRAIAPLLVLVGIAAAGIITYPYLALATAMVIYLVHLPYAVYRYQWLGAHPEAWDVPPRERRAIRRARRQLGLRRPLRRRVAGAAIKVRSVRLPRRNGTGSRNGSARSWRRLGLRRARRDAGID